MKHALAIIALLTALPACAQSSLQQIQQQNEQIQQQNEQILHNQHKQQKQQRRQQQNEQMNYLLQQQVAEQDRMNEWIRNKLKDVGR